MTRPKARTTKPNRRFVVWSQRREPPDVRKLGRVLLAVVLTEQQAAAIEPADEESLDVE